MKLWMAAIAASALLSGMAVAEDQPRGSQNEGHAQVHGGARGEMHRGQPGQMGHEQGGNAMHNQPMRNQPTMDRHFDQGGPHANVNAPHGNFTGPHGNFGQFHGNFHADHRFHAGPWHPPSGYVYRHWTYGQRLPALYFGSSFWITSFGLYGLMAPPPGAVWVRSGPDALLVDRDTGEIIRVEYGVFY